MIQTVSTSSICISFPFHSEMSHFNKWIKKLISCWLFTILLLQNKKTLNKQPNKMNILIKSLQIIKLCIVWLTVNCPSYLMHFLPVKHSQPLQPEQWALSRDLVALQWFWKEVWLSPLPVGKIPGPCNCQGLELIMSTFPSYGE